jgi:asparagine synthase (glutamine-hydrolysing)
VASYDDAVCGIGGCVTRGGITPPYERLEAMRAALAHRGPDGSGIEVVGNVGLVHTRLAIVDTSDRARQPMHDQASGWWLSFNGEIYNHARLRHELGERPFASSGDTETLLRALASWGPSAVLRFNGQFALAALDRRGGRLLLTRDRFGIKPLYLAETPEGLWFASEPAAIVAAGVRARWPADGWQLVRQGSCYSGERTLADGIRRVPPGIWASVSLETGQLTEKRWTSPAELVDIDRSNATARLGRRRLADELHRTLRHAVHDALMADVPVGTLCSGGVDSSLVAAFAAEARTDLVAFGARYRGEPQLDEGPAARRAASALGIELDLLEVTETGWRSGFVSSTVHFGAPLANASSVVIAQMAARARQQGIKVILTGEGADELFAGYGGLHKKALDAFLSRPARLIRAVEPAFAARLASVKRPARESAPTLRPGKRNEPGWSSLTSAPDRRPAANEAKAAYLHHRGSRGDLESALLGRMDYTLCHLLNRMDKNMMQHSVEARVPFLDPAVVGLVLNLPLESRVGPWSKGLLRDVARRMLPCDLAYRQKIYGMDFDAGAWIEAAAEPRFLTDGVLRDVLDMGRHDLRAQLEASRKADRVRIWSAEVWCRSILAGQSVRSIESELWRAGP